MPEGFGCGSFYLESFTAHALSAVSHLTVLQPSLGRFAAIVKKKTPKVSTHIDKRRPSLYSDHTSLCILPVRRLLRNLTASRASNVAAAQLTHEVNYAFDVNGGFPYLHRPVFFSVLEEGGWPSKCPNQHDA